MPQTGAAVGYALNALEERGILFIAPGDMLYEGMVIGEDPVLDAQRFRVSEKGVVLVTRDMMARL